MQEQLPPTYIPPGGSQLPSPTSANGGGGGIPPHFIIPAVLIVVISFGTKLFILEPPRYEGTIPIPHQSDYGNEAVNEYSETRNDSLAKLQLLKFQNSWLEFQEELSLELDEETKRKLNEEWQAQHGHRNRGKITLKLPRRHAFKRTSFELIRMFPPSEPPGGGSPKPLLTEAEMTSVNMQDCEKDYELCIGTGGTLSAGFSCGPAGTSIEFSADGEITLAASKDNQGQSILVAGAFSDVQSQPEIIYNPIVVEKQTVINGTVQTETVLDPEAFIVKFNEHYKSSTCPVTTVDFCVTKDDPSMGFTINCDGASTSVKLNGTMTVSASSNDGRTALIEIGGARK